MKKIFDKVSKKRLFEYRNSRSRIRLKVNFKFGGSITLIESITS